MDRREFLEKAALIGAAPFVSPSTLFAASVVPVPSPVSKVRLIGDLYDATTIQPLLVGLLESFVPELQRRGYYTWFDDRYPDMWYHVDLRVAWDPIAVKTTPCGIDASYVIDCGRPSLMVSLSPYKSNDSYFTEGWKRPSMEEFVTMFQTADRAPILAQVLDKLMEPGRVPLPAPSHYCRQCRFGNHDRCSLIIRGPIGEVVTCCSCDHGYKETSD